jgi:hypothetical protein
MPGRKQIGITARKGAACLDHNDPLLVFPFPNAEPLPFLKEPWLRAMRTWLDLLSERSAEEIISVNEYNVYDFF